VFTSTFYMFQISDLVKMFFSSFLFRVERFPSGGRLRKPSPSASLHRPATSGVSASSVGRSCRTANDRTGTGPIKTS
jgi:hypothetical protein